MSLYQPPQAFPDIGYPNPAYVQRHQPPPPGPYGYPVAPAGISQPVYYDPNTFRRDYASRLAELNINSRPIIQSLSMMAQDHTRWAEIVAQCIEAHIRRVPPWMKLPAFYLLDAISKNVYEPYARYFTPFVIPLFLETYGQVDPTTRSKMEEMLLTWRTGGPGGKELFGIGAQVAIERGIWGGGSSEPQGAPSNATLSRGQVLSELDFTLSQKERILSANPYDSVTQNHVSVLRQLRNLVEVGVSQEELRQILGQLRMLARTAAPPPPPTAPVYAQPPASVSASYGSPATNPRYPPALPYQQSPDFSSLMSNQSAVPGSSVPSSSTSTPVPSLEGIFSALVKAGVVASRQGADSSANGDEDVKPDSTDFEREASRQYRRSILKHKVKLTSTDISRQRAPIANLLYERLPAQCKQCGIRFRDGAKGKKELDDHLDIHFRQNRKATQNVGRGHSRSWFISIEDWIHEAEDLKGKARGDGSRRLTMKEAAAADLAKRDAELRAQFVVVPPGDEAKPISCPICKEHLKSEFLEDDEDWVWRNAVKKDDRIYHATCHAEASISTTTLASRLKAELSGSVDSRSATPETSPGKTSKSPTPETLVNALKRKAEDDEYPPNPEGDGTPPMKKLAVSA